MHNDIPTRYAKDALQSIIVARCHQVFLEWIKKTSNLPSVIGRPLCCSPVFGVDPGAPTQAYTGSESPASPKEYGRVPASLSPWLSVTA